MATSTPTSKKRKAQDTALPSASSVSVLEASSSVGPAWVNFPAVRPSKKTAFKVYRRDDEADVTADFDKQPTLIAGETGDMEFYSINKDYDMPEENYNCQYVPALYDPATNSLVVQPAAPTYILVQTVKRLKTLGPTTNLSNPNDQRMLRRDQLGETFGTRKAKSRIKAAERNKVDAEAQAGVKDHLLSSIEVASANIPTADALALLANTSRLIPPPDLETTEPEKVYTLEKLIPTEEYNAIDPAPIVKAEDDRSRMELLPFRSSRWIEQKLRLALAQPFALKKTAVKILYYIACLRQFTKMKGKLGKSEELVEKMNGMPKVIIDGLIKRFTEVAKGSTIPVVTAAMEHKLLAYQFALRLRCENYACDVDPIATDLQMPPAKVKEVFKSLGCTVEKPSTADKERLGMSAEEGKTQKAILQAPPVFPKPKKRGPAKR